MCLCAHRIFHLYVCEAVPSAKPVTSAVAAQRENAKAFLSPLPDPEVELFIDAVLSTDFRIQHINHEYQSCSF